MLYQVIIAMIVLSILMYGIELLPMPATPKRVIMGALVLITGLTFAERGGLLR